MQWWHLSGGGGPGRVQPDPFCTLGARWRCVVNYTPRLKRVSVHILEQTECTFVPVETKV
jgi:hypothetical protein